MENILKVFLMAFPEWLAVIFMVVGLVVTALAAVRLGYGLVVAKTVYKWIVNAEEKFGSGAGAEKKAHVIAVLRGYTPTGWTGRSMSGRWTGSCRSCSTSPRRSSKITWKRNPQKPLLWPTSVTWGRTTRIAGSKRCWNLSSNTGRNGFSASWRQV